MIRSLFLSSTLLLASGCGPDPEADCESLRPLLADVRDAHASGDDDRFTTAYAAFLSGLLDIDERTPVVFNEGLASAVQSADGLKHTEWEHRAATASGDSTSAVFWSDEASEYESALSGALEALDCSAFR